MNLYRPSFNFAPSDSGKENRGTKFHCCLKKLLSKLLVEREFGCHLKIYTTKFLLKKQPLGQLLVTRLVRTADRRLDYELLLFAVRNTLFF